MYERILRSAIYGYGTGRKLRNSWGRHEVAGGTHGNLKESYMEKKKRKCLGIARCYKLLHRVGLRVQGQLRRKPTEKPRMNVFFSYVGTYRGG